MEEEGGNKKPQASRQAVKPKAEHFSLIFFRRDAVKNKKNKNEYEGEQQQRASKLERRCL
jgi:hypothetical protein